MSYCVIMTGNLSFANLAEKQKFLDTLAADEDFANANYTSVKKFLREELTEEFEKQTELEYSIHSSDIHYFEQDNILVDILKNDDIDAHLDIEFIGEDGESWRISYSKLEKDCREDKVYISDKLVCCKDCLFGHYCQYSEANNEIRYKCEYWTKLAGNNINILMDANEFCSRGKSKHQSEQRGENDD